MLFWKYSYYVVCFVNWKHSIGSGTDVKASEPKNLHFEDFIGTTPNKKNQLQQAHHPLCLHVPPSHQDSTPSESSHSASS